MRIVQVSNKKKRPNIDIDGYLKEEAIDVWEIMKTKLNFGKTQTILSRLAVRGGLKPVQITMHLTDSIF